MEGQVRRPHPEDRGEGEGLIVPVKGGFIVKSESGRNLSKVLPTRKAAEKRLLQVEYFKHKGKGGK